MYITISYWVAYGVFLVINLHQFFWGLSLKPKQPKDSFPALALWAFPLSIMLTFASVMGFGLPLIQGAVDPSREAMIMSTLFILWAVLTVIIFIVLLVEYLRIRYFKK